jgi:hypothetical protein
MQIPDREHTIQSAIDAYHESKTESPRAHLGCSQIGGPCKRATWLKFRWAVNEKFSGRMLRLFRRGQLEEKTVVEDLRAIGCEVKDCGANQRRVEFGSFVSGSIDGIIKHGLPGAEKTEHVLEIKTHSEKSFEEVKKKGVQDAKPEHYVQMQLYMLGTGIQRALYYAVNKNTDEVYTERVKLDSEFASKCKEDAQKLALSDRIPEPLSTNPSWYQCKYCVGHSVCHGKEPVKEINCRTCAHATFQADSKVKCERWDSIVPTSGQIQACRSHCFHPDMVPWKLDTANSTQWSACYDGKLNGEDGFSSNEMISGALEDDEVMKVRNIFEGEIVDNDL